MSGRKECVACGKVAPETHGDDTLTTTHGWRVRRGAPSGRGNLLEWRCPPCWQKFKASQDAGVEPGATVVPPSDSNRGRS
ncbi:MAG TPA: hypothetical protein VGI39_28430 [Polyangiaceae bacterium]